jgi:hypothetical protein
MRVHSAQMNNIRVMIDTTMGIEPGPIQRVELRTLELLE